MSQSSPNLKHDPLEDNTAAISVSQVSQAGELCRPGGKKTCEKPW